MHNRLKTQIFNLLDSPYHVWSRTQLCIMLPFLFLLGAVTRDEQFAFIMSYTVINIILYSMIFLSSVFNRSMFRRHEHIIDSEPVDYADIVKFTQLINFTQRKPFVKPVCIVLQVANLACGIWFTTMASEFPISAWVQVAMFGLGLYMFQTTAIPLTLNNLCAIQEKRVDEFLKQTLGVNPDEEI